MDIQTEKIELAKRLLDTEDQRLIEAVKSLFHRFDSDENLGDLSDNVISDARESIRQIESGAGIPHNLARETYKKWL